MNLSEDGRDSRMGAKKIRKYTMPHIFEYIIKLNQVSRFFIIPLSKLSFKENRLFSLLNATHYRQQIHIFTTINKNLVHLIIKNSTFSSI